MTALTYQGSLSGGGFEVLLRYAAKHEMYAILEITNAARNGKLVLASGRVVLEDADDVKSRRIAQHKMVELIRHNHGNAGNYACTPLVDISKADSLPSIAIPDLLRAALGSGVEPAVVAAPAALEARAPSPPAAPIARTPAASSPAAPTPTQPAPAQPAPAAAVPTPAPAPATAAPASTPAPNPAAAPAAQPASAAVPAPTSSRFAARPHMGGAAQPLETIQPQRASQLRELLQESRDSLAEASLDRTTDSAGATAVDGSVVDSIADSADDESSRSAALRSIIRRLAS